MKHYFFLPNILKTYQLHRNHSITSKSNRYGSPQLPIRYIGGTKDDGGSPVTTKILKLIFTYSLDPARTELRTRTGPRTRTTTKTTTRTRTNMEARIRTIIRTKTGPRIRTRAASRSNHRNRMSQLSSHSYRTNWVNWIQPLSVIIMCHDVQVGGNERGMQWGKGIGRRRGYGKGIEVKG